MITGTATQAPDPADDWVICKGCNEENHITDICECGYEESEPDYPYDYLDEQWD